MAPGVNIRGMSIEQLAEKLEEERRPKTRKEKLDDVKKRVLGEVVAENQDKAKKQERKERLEQTKKRLIREAIQEAEAEKEKEIEVKDEDIISEELLPETEAPEETESREKSPVAGYLKNSLGAHPELQTPEIKKAISDLNKSEKIYDRNKGNSKKAAQEKARQAVADIKEAKKTINDYIRELERNYTEWTSYLTQKGEELFGEDKGGGKHAPGLADKINAIYQKQFGQDKAYNLEKSGFFGGTKRFFQDRQLKKKLSKGEWEKFETLRLEYETALADYNAFSGKYTKKFSRLNEALEAGEGSGMLYGPPKHGKIWEV